MSTDKKQPTPEERLHTKEHRAHVEVEVLDAAAGAAAGAAVGILGGPIGMAAGAVIGAATGAILGAQLEKDEHQEAEHEKELDAIGVEPLSKPPPDKKG